MKVKEFYSLTQGERALSINGEVPFCGHDFWAKYSRTEIWESEIERVFLSVSRSEVSRLWFDRVICNIILKE